MELKSIHRPAWTQDRFMVFFVLAAGLHAVLFFGINFGVFLSPVPRLADTLDVVLVQWRSEEAPEEADYLAQANQTGGGETTDGGLGCELSQTSWWQGDGQMCSGS